MKIKLYLVEPNIIMLAEIGVGLKVDGLATSLNIRSPSPTSRRPA